jgi:hypothetical protein
MGLGFIHSSDPSEIHPDLQDWLAKAKKAVVGQKAVDVCAQDNNIIIHFENGQALIFIDPYGKGVGHLTATIEDDDIPTEDEASLN